MKTKFSLSFLLTINLLFSQSFVTTWKTDNSGVSNGTSITIPTFTGETYNYNVDWDNDGVFDEFGITGDITHDFGFSGTYTISIQGTFPRIYFNNQGDKEKLLFVNQWGRQKWTSMELAFYGCVNLEIVAIDIPNLENVNSMAYMFAATSFFNNDIGNWDVSHVTDLEAMFGDAFTFNQDISNWDVSNVENMASMFSGAASFNQDISSWNVSNVENMHGMFYGTNSFNQDIGNWDTSSVTNMSYMFFGASVFNHEIDNWDTTNVTNMRGMFENAFNFNRSLGNWSVSNVADMTNMFKNITLSTDNYDNILLQWDAQALQNKVNFHGGNSKYCDGEVARNNMTQSDKWKITDGGRKVNCISKISTKQFDSSVIKNDVVNHQRNIIKFYPNPVQDILFIKGLDKKAEVVITNIAGKVIRHIDGEIAQNGINVSNLQNAIYFLKIALGNEIVIKKFIKE
ncbi:BspA family leucine-rich repeat surface protein [Winogradskyella sp.]|uniref:BspA family leucine-rich repeat surface protein n=1 Tax=Winogradskyella sp. TaxID=1883156 RepID=UPI001B2B832C|nr:BspA family leucine-rich repeat surface protein [Winogradskyella sp.]MBO6879436.1 BspA family leucine-rich repeat surface protein [Winogradskyella sp.]